MLPFIITLFIFAIFGIVAILIWMNIKARRKKHMLIAIQGANASINIKKDKTSAQDQRRSDLAKKLKGEEKAKDDKKTSLSDMIVQAGMSISVKQFWLFSFINGIAFFVLATVMGLAPIVKILVVITAILGLPRLFLKKKAQKRQKDFMADFPDALESMMRLLKAGMPVSEAIKMVAQEFDGPIGEEMEQVFEQQKIGVPLPEAVLKSIRGDYCGASCFCGNGHVFFKPRIYRGVIYRPNRKISSWRFYILDVYRLCRYASDD